MPYRLDLDTANPIGKRSSPVQPKIETHLSAVGTICMLGGRYLRQPTDISHLAFALAKPAAMLAQVCLYMYG